jgi:hypothetical protein
MAARADLVAHFRFDDDLKDATGQHDGRPVDPKLAPVFAPGRFGSAVVIEKVNAGIELANPSAIDFSRDFTLATWVNVGNYYAEMPVLFKGRADLTTAPDKFFGVFGIDGMQVHGEGQGEWITNFRASNGLVPNDGGWHHLAVTYRAAEAPHFTLYVDGQGKTPADKGTFRGVDFTLKPDAPDSVLRIGCRADGDTWRYVRSHLRGLLDELQLYDEALKAEDIRFLFEYPGRTAKQRDSVTFALRFQFDPGHPWRPPFGVERVGLTPVIVQFASDTHPAPAHWLAAYREGKEVERKALDVSGPPPLHRPRDLRHFARAGGTGAASENQGRQHGRAGPLEGRASGPGGGCEGGGRSRDEHGRSRRDPAAGGLARAGAGAAGPRHGRGLLREGNDLRCGSARVV